jgi:hypothetical protein
MIENYRTMLEAGIADEEVGILDVALMGGGEGYDSGEAGAVFSEELEDQFVINALASDSVDSSSRQ